jgi:very-short-patch-repair endonuclease
MKPVSPLKSGIVFLQKVTGGKVEYSRKLRSEMTEAEAVLWKHLRNRKLEGFKFRRQQIVEGFIVDFFCEEAKLVVEVDGGVHDTEEQKKIDEHRREVFKIRGLVEIRFKNVVIVETIESVLKSIRETVVNRVFFRSVRNNRPHPSVSPLRQERGG